MMAHRFWRYFLTGLLVILPTLLTLAVLQIIFGWFFRFMIDPMGRLLIPLLPGWADSRFLVRLAVLLTFILGVAAIGFATRVLVARRLGTLFEELVRRVPMVGKIYGTSREIANTFAGKRKGLLSRVVLLEWPRDKMYAIGFVTSEGKGEVQEKTPEYVVNVFIPTTPNPTSGYLVLAPREQLIPLEMSVEDAMRLVISGGVSGPEVRLPAGGGMSDRPDDGRT